MGKNFKRIVLGTMGICLLAGLTIEDFYQFVFRYDGIAFYRERPELIAVCAAIGIAGAVFMNCCTRAYKNNRMQTIVRSYAVNRAGKRPLGTGRK